MNNLQNLKKTVKELLVGNAKLRDDDDLLYFEIIKLSNLEEFTPIDVFFRIRRLHGIPSFESVRRTRQKVQAENPELRGTKVSEREKAEQDFLEFARS